MGARRTQRIGALIACVLIMLVAHTRSAAAGEVDWAQLPGFAGLDSNGERFNSAFARIEPDPHGPFARSALGRDTSPVDEETAAFKYLNDPQTRSALRIHLRETLSARPHYSSHPRDPQWASIGFERRVGTTRLYSGITVYVKHGEVAAVRAPTRVVCTDAMVAALDAMEQDPGRYVSRERALEIAREDNRPAVEKDPYAHIRGNPPPVIELFLVNDPDPLQWDVQIPSVRYRISAHTGAILRKHSLVKIN